MQILSLEEAQFELSVYADLYRLIFSDYYLPLTISPQRLARQLASGTISPHFSLVVVIDDRPVALTLAGIEPISGQLSVQALGVIPELRRQGVGRAMIEELKRRAQNDGVSEISLMVMRTNRRALIFYQKTGFRSVGLRECYSLTLPARLPRANQRLKIAKIPSGLWEEPPLSELNKEPSPPLLVLVAYAGARNVGHLVMSGEETLTIESLYVQSLSRRQSVVVSLLRAGLAARPLAQKVRINYLPYRAKEMRRLLRRLGFDCFCRLEEMVCPLSASREGNCSAVVEGESWEQRSC